MKDELLKLLDEEIKFAKSTGMPQFVMGLIQARKIVLEYNGNCDSDD